MRNAIAIQNPKGNNIVLMVTSSVPVITSIASTTQNSIATGNRANTFAACLKMVENLFMFFLIKITKCKDKHFFNCLDTLVFDSQQAAFAMPP